MPLSDTAVRLAKPLDKPYRMTDGQGLYLLVQPNSSKWWRFDYRFQGTRKTLSLGVYPAIGLKQARELRDQHRQTVASGIDPSDTRKDEKAIREAEALTFQKVAMEFHAHRADIWTPGYSKQVLTRWQADIFPVFGSYPIAEITAPIVLEALRKIEARGVRDAAHRIKQSVGAVFAYGVACGYCDRNPASDLSGALKPTKKQHRATITNEKEVADMMRAIDSFEGTLVVKCALQWSALTFVRPGEVRHAEWSEIDIDRLEWRIPAHKMKMRVQHVVPLSKQAVEVLGLLRPLTGQGKYIFPNLRTPNGSRPMSENAVLVALRNMGYTQDQMCAHGFRGMASTRLNESYQWHPDVIERQLAHGEQDEVRGAYDHSQHMPERVKMMQWWADYLDGLKAGAVVLQFNRRAG
jgi:integrase